MTAILASGFALLFSVSPTMRAGDKTGAAWKQQTLWKGDAGDFVTLAFSGSGETLAAGGKTGLVKLWDVAGSKIKTTLRGHVRPLVCLSFVGDDKTLASLSQDGVLKVWDVAAGRERSTFRLQPNVPCAAFAADGKTLATAAAAANFGTASGKVHLWDVATGKLKATLAGHDISTYQLAFSADGKYLASAGARYIGGESGQGGSVGMEVNLWTLGSRRQPTILPASVAADFAPDGKTLAVLGTQASGKRTLGYVNLVDVAAWKLRSALKGHADVITSQAYSFDSKLLATASADHTIKLWNVADGKERATLKGHRGSVLAIAFSPRRPLLASAGADNTVRLWVPEETATQEK